MISRPDDVQLLELICIYAFFMSIKQDCPPSTMFKSTFMPQSTPLGRGYGNIPNISTETLSWQSNLTAWKSLNDQSASSAIN